MKRIYMRSIPDDRFPEGTSDYTANVLIWEEAIKQIIRRPQDPTKGAEVEEIRKGIRVFDAIDKVGDNHVLELEDADYDHLKAKTMAMQWAFVDKRILTLIDDILNAGEQVDLGAQLEEEQRNGVPASV